MMSRVAWKLPYINRIFFSEHFSSGEFFPLWKRNSVISPFFLNKAFTLYNGRGFVSIAVSTDMLGRKFGEFSITKALGYRETKKNSKKRSTKFKKK